MFLNGQGGMVYALLLTFVVGFISGRLVGSFRNRSISEREEPEKIPLVPVIIISVVFGFVLGLFF